MSLIEVGEIDRTKYLGGGDIAAIMGVGGVYKGRQQTPFTVYQKKMGLAPELTEDEEKFFRNRKRYEAPVVATLREEFDGDIVAVNKRYKNTDFPDYFAAEIDWEWMERHTGMLQNGETKTVYPLAFNERQGWGEAGTQDYPVQYAAQNMWGLGLTGRQKCVIAPLIGFEITGFYYLDFVQEVFDDMVAKADRFWNDHVIPGIPPEPLNLDDCMDFVLRMSGRAVEIGDELAGKLNELRVIRSTNKANKEAENEIKFEVMNHLRKAWAISGDASLKDDARIMHQGVQIATYKQQTAVRIDVERLREEKPDIALEYSKSSNSRVLRLSKQF